jgi:hypothetical protein
MEKELLIALEPPRQHDFIRVSKTDGGVYIEIPPNRGTLDPVTVKLTAYLAGWLAAALKEITSAEDHQEVGGADGRAGASQAGQNPWYPRQEG